MKFILKLLVSSFAVAITAWLLGGVDIKEGSYLTAIVVAFVLALLNALLKPVLIILTIPVTILSFGLFLLVINAFIIQLAGYLIKDFVVESFWWALLFSIILSLVTWLLELPVKSRQRRDQY